MARALNRLLPRLAAAQATPSLRQLHSSALRQERQEVLLGAGYGGFGSSRPAVHFFFEMFVDG